MTFIEEIKNEQFTSDRIGLCVLLLDMKKKPSEIKELVNKYFGIDSFAQINNYIERAKNYIIQRNKN